MSLMHIIIALLCFSRQCLVVLTGGGLVYDEVLHSHFQVVKLHLGCSLVKN